MRNHFAPRRPTRPPARLARRPRLEPCEARTLLTAFTVTSLTDTGAGSGTSGDLRYCITQADKDTSTDTISIFSTGTINLTAALPALSGTHSISISGPGAARLTVKGVTSTGNSGAFTVNSGTTATLSDMTITGATGALAGGIVNSGTLTLANMTLTGNSGYTGGGIRSDGMLTVTNSTFSNNTASYGGGGLFLGSGQASITASTVANNRTTAGAGGGGIYNGNATLTVSASTLAGNSASNVGGGLLNANTSAVYLTNSTVANNSARTGGGLDNLSTGPLDVVESTIANNSATTAGGGINNNAPVAANYLVSATYLLNSIVAGNTITGSTNASDLAGYPVVVGSGNDLIGTGGSGGLKNGVAGNLVGVAQPGLGTLGNYGGPTQTIPLLAGSPAIDAAADFAGASVDQRGAQRGPSGLDAGTHADIGAFEDTSSYLVTTAADSLAAGTLRSAVAWANQSTNPRTTTDPNTIRFDTANTFSSPQTITLDPTLGTLALSGQSVAEAIAGPGAASLTVQGGGTTSNFTVVTVASGTTASLANFTISNGNATGANNVLAGGISSLGSLSLSGMTLSHNTGYTGGAVRSDGVSTTVTGSTFSNNSASFGGGGLFTGSGTLTITNSTFSGDSAADRGGAIYNGGSAQMSVGGSTFTSNSATNGGGGIYSETTLNVSGSTFTGNTAGTASAGGFGGGIENFAGTATVNTSTFTNNSSGHGGGIFNQATLNVAGSFFTGNSATGSGFGGGIENYAGSATVNTSTFTNNSATYAGAGIYNQATLNVAGSTFTGNSATGNGGGIANFVGTATVTGSTFTKNSSFDGSGIDNQATLAVDGSTFSNNSASDVGGGIEQFAGSLNLSNSTMISNSAIVDGGGIDTSGGTSTVSNSTFTMNSSAEGGAIFNEPGSLTLINSTLSGNSAKYDAGGLHATSSTTLVNTIVAANTLTNSTTASDINGNVAASSHNNLIGSGGSGGLNNGSNGNIVLAAGQSAGLGTLGNYGGSTQTIPLLPGSPALDAGSNADVPTGTTTDQRGRTRIVNGTVDIGAFESGGFQLAVGVRSTPQSTSVNTAFASPLAVKVVANYASDPVAGGTVSFTAPATGASATLGSTPVVTDSSGQASTTATANGVAGSYGVTASVGGANPVASFSLTNLAAVVSGTVGVGWGTSGSATLLTNADGLRLLPSGRTTDLPWSGIQTLRITLNAPATLNASDVSVTGITGANYGPVTVSGSGTSYTITLAQPITNADRVTITIGNAGIATFTRRLDVLPGDVTDDGVVDASDLSAERNAVVGAAPMSLFTDIDGDGTTTSADYNLVRKKVNTRLP